jgi:hypothetical protein
LLRERLARKPMLRDLTRSRRTPVHRTLRRVVCAIALAASPAAFSCSTPVYRYALERWMPQPYDIVVFQPGMAKPDDKSADPAHQALNESEANITVTDVDVSAPILPEYAALWSACKDKPLPWMAVRFPQNVPADGPFCSVAFTVENIARLLHSPLRQRLAERMTAGDAAEWILVESGDKAADDSKAELLQNTLKKLSDDFTVAAHDRALANEPGDPDIQDPPNRRPNDDAGKVTFSLMRVAHASPEEEIFLRMLVGNEQPAATGADPQPRAFLVFGRGRVLGSMTGTEIQEANIQTASAFLSGPCMCEVKEQNPGMDLLMDVNWNEVLNHKTNDIQTELKPESAPIHVLPASAPAAPASVPQTITVPSPPTPPVPPTPPMPRAPRTAGASYSLGLCSAILMVLGGCVLLWWSRRGSKL